MATSIRDIIDSKLKSSSPDKDLLDYCNKSYNSARQGRASFENTWYMHLAFYFGKHYAQWASSALEGTGVQTEASFSKLYEPKVPSWRVRLVTNKIRTTIRGELAKITREKPRGFVIPSTTDEADLAGARAGEAIHEYLWRELSMNRTIRQAVFWELITGTAFVKDWYDSNVVGLDGIKGKICAESVTPFHLLVPDLQEQELENQPYLIHEMAKDADWVSKHFKDSDGNPIVVNPDSASSGGGLLEQRFLSALGITSSSSAKKYVSVREGWYKPCTKYPDGLYIIWTQEKVLFSSKKWLYKHKEFPFTKFEHIPTGRFYAESSIADLIPIQKEINRTKSQLVEAKNRMSKPQLLAVRGSIDVNKITSEPGLVIQYTPGFAPPTVLPLQNLPSYVIDQLNALQQDYDNAASQHEISQGKVPGQVSAATAISFLQEQDDSKLLLTVASLEEGVEKIGKHFLSHVAQFWQAERMVQVTGVNGQWESYKFKSESLHGNTNFKIEAGSATPVSRAAKQAFILELMKSGYVPPEQGLKYLDMSETGRMYEELQRDARQAQRENMRLAEGEPAFGPNTFDVDLIHIQEHEGYCKTEEYESSKEEIKAAFQAHLTGHRMKMALMQGLQLAPDDPTLIAIGRGQPVPAQQMGMMPGGQPQLNAGAPQGSPPQEAQTQV